MILADGGITQIRAIKNAMNDVGVEIPVFGMVKDDKHSTRALIDEEKNEFKISENLFHFITNLQDEVHKTAIEYHRKVRDKEMTKSKLDYIEGIGEKKRTELLKKFGSVNKIKEAETEEIAKIKGIETFLPMVEKIKEKYPHVKRIYVRADYPDVSGNYENYILEFYDDTYYPEKIVGAGRAAYVERNREMIDKSCFCIVYYDEQCTPKVRKSGTKIALDYAVRKGRNLVIFPYSSK